MKRRRDPIQLRLDRAKYRHVNRSSEKALITVDILVDRIIAVCRLCRLVQLRLSTLNEESLSTCTCAIPHDSPLLVFFVTISNIKNGDFLISFLNIPESKHGFLSSWAYPFSRSQLVPPPGREFPRDKVPPPRWGVSTWQSLCRLCIFGWRKANPPKKNCLFKFIPIHVDEPLGRVL